MSADIKVFINKNDMISAEKWSQLIVENEFELTFFPDFNVNELQGWLPCKYRGEDAGFEYYFDGLEDTMFSVENNPKLLGKDTCISFSSPYEQVNLASAMIASAILVKYCHGVYWIMDDFESGEDPIEMARHLEKHGFER